jgi:hypothetical protein
VQDKGERGPGSHEILAGVQRETYRAQNYSWAQTDVVTGFSLYVACAADYSSDVRKICTRRCRFVTPSSRFIPSSNNRNQTAPG